MHETSVEYLYCVRCSSQLELDVLTGKRQVTEGFLLCNNCNQVYPIISEIPIIWDSFSDYISNRRILAGFLYSTSKNEKMKLFLKNSLAKTKFLKEDRSQLEKRWSRIYGHSKDSKFYLKIKKILDQIPQTKLVIEHGCSIGTITEHLTKNNDRVFGIDRSFYAILYAKKRCRKNLDYFVADSMRHPFGQQKFDLVMALNLLEIVEPLEFLKIISQQINSGFLIISDPYDYDRGQNSVRNKLYEKTLRSNLRKLNFRITMKTQTPSYIPWKLNLNSRAQLIYSADLVVAKK